MKARVHLASRSGSLLPNTLPLLSSNTKRYLSLEKLSTIPVTFVRNTANSAERCPIRVFHSIPAHLTGRAVHATGRVATLNEGTNTESPNARGSFRPTDSERRNLGALRLLGSSAARSEWWWRRRRVWWWWRAAVVVAVAAERRAVRSSRPRWWERADAGEPRRANRAECRANSREKRIDASGGGGVNVALVCMHEFCMGVRGWG